MILKVLTALSEFVLSKKYLYIAWKKRFYSHGITRLIIVWSAVIILYLVTVECFCCTLGTECGDIVFRLLSNLMYPAVLRRS